MDSEVGRADQLARDADCRDQGGPALRHPRPGAGRRTATGHLFFAFATALVPSAGVGNRERHQRGSTVSADWPAVAMQRLSPRATAALQAYKQDQQVQERAGQETGHV